MFIGTAAPRPNLDHRTIAGRLYRENNFQNPILVTITNRVSPLQDLLKPNELQRGAMAFPAVQPVLPANRLDQVQ
ncbi:MAG: hypothetical protein CMJ81_21825 [Planctomycetaceae bacterium]|nr:hypothetical protein [Planctomycetaceae bacterium]MBP60875.1 hypothetical protein [Planctomycetaceae bacterium]